MSRHVTEDTRHLTASMVVIDPQAEAVLLVFHNATQKWMFPGGHVDQNETPVEAALREVYEETGVRATVLDRQDIELPGMTWQPSPWLTAEIPAPAKPERPGKPAEPAHHHIDLLFVGTARAHDRITVRIDEVASVRWQPLDELGDLDVRDEVPAVARAAHQRIVIAGH